MLGGKGCVQQEREGVQKLIEFQNVRVSLDGMTYYMQPESGYCLVVLPESSFGGREFLDPIRNDKGTLSEIMTPKGQPRES